MKPKNDISREEVEELIAYDPDTGVFVWKQNRTNGVKAGREAGRIAINGYRQISLYGRRYYAARLAWLLAHGEWPLEQIDHINCDQADDRLANLRLCSQNENMANCRRGKGNTTGFKGVSYVESHRGAKKFKAYIKKDRKLHFLGWFPDAESAAAARAGAAAILHGPFARNE